MREVKNMKVEIADEHHIFVDNKQFVSLKRFGEAKKAIAEEIKLLADKNEELAKENEALKILLKKQLNDIEESPSTAALVNKMCTSEDDHEWECIGMSTAGSDYRCKKCYAHKTVPSDYHPLSVTL